MIEASLGDIAEAIGSLRTGGFTKGRRFAGVSIDSRTVSKGNLFFAIRGKNEDGHRYVSDAISRGASAIIVSADYSRMGASTSEDCIAVEDTLSAMHKLALWWLSRFDITKIAVTGTNGKTTTKEMISAVLATRYRTYKSPGNLNNLYGVPLAIFGMGESFEVAVLEFGMSTQGEIATLTNLVKPQYGLITNIEAAHIETMLSIDAIARAKFELLDNMPGEGTAIFNLDNAYLRRRFDTEKLAKLGYGVKEVCDVSPSSFEINGSGRAKFHLDATGEIHLAAPGIHNMYNALAAIAVGRLLSVPGESMKAALESFQPIAMRMETVNVNDVLIINDTYNANPASMRYALDTLAAMRIDGRRFAVLGNMLELGEMASQLHREVGSYAAGTKPDRLVTCGDLARGISEGAAACGYPDAGMRHFADVNDVIAYLLDSLHPGDAILVKASRSMAFDRITLGLRSQLGRVN